MENKIKSRAWGRCFNVPGECIDTANNVWCFSDPRRAWRAFDAVRDKGAAAAADTLVLQAWMGTPEATFAALRLAVAPEGGGVLCPSIASVKWWAEPAGDLHADIRGEVDGGYVDTAPEIAARIVASRSTLPFAAGAIAAAVTDRPAQCGWRVDSDTSTAASEISELLGGVSLSWTIVGGEIVFRPWQWSAPTRSARSEKVNRRKVYKPVGSYKLGFRRNWAPMARSDLAAIVLAGDVTYQDGTTVESLKPAQPGADVTAMNTSADTAAVGGRPAGDVVQAIDQAKASLDINVPSLFELAKATATLTAYAQARTTLEGKAVGTIVTEVKEVGESSVETLSLIGAKNAGGTGFVLTLETVMVDADTTLAQRFVQTQTYTDDGLGALSETLQQAITDGDHAAAERLDSVEATLNGDDGLTAQVSFLQSALVTTDGQTVAKAVLSVKANGRIGGIVATNDGAAATLDLDFDSTRIFRPDGTLLFEADEDGVYMPNVEVDRISYGALVDKFANEHQQLNPSGGFQLLPGGFIIQWGQYRQTIGSEVGVSIVFPMSFPTSVMAVNATPFIAAASDTRDLWLQNLGQPSLTGVSFYTQAATTSNRTIDGFDWMAFGK